ARAAAAAIEGTTQRPTEARTGVCVPWCGPGRGIQIAVKNLGHEVIGHREQVFVRCRRASARGMARQGARITWATECPLAALMDRLHRLQSPRETTMASARGEIKPG